MVPDLRLAETATQSSQYSVPQLSTQSLAQRLKPSGAFQPLGAAQPSGTFQPSDAAQFASQHSPLEGSVAASSAASQDQAAVKGAAMPPSVPASDRPPRVGRVAIESLGGLQWQIEGADADVERQLYTSIFHLKALIRESRSAAMVSFPAGGFVTSLLALFDCLHNVASSHT